MHWISIVLSVLAFALSVWAVRRPKPRLPKEIAKLLDADLSAQGRQVGIMRAEGATLEEAMAKLQARIAKEKPS